MNSKNVLLLLGVIILLFSYIIFNEKIKFSNTYNLNEVNIKNRNFKYINSSFPIENFIKLNDEFLICSSFQYPKIFITKEYLSSQIEDGSLYLYNIKKDELQQLQIENFPKNVPFQPHGISLYKINEEKYYIFIINHSIKLDLEENEERIEKILLIFEKKTISLSFKNTITLPKNFFGIIDSIAVIDLNTIYFTTKNYFPLPSFSYDNQNIKTYLNIAKYKLYDWLNVLFQKLNLKKTYLYSYHWEKGKINLISNSEGFSNDGLAYNREKSILYMARPQEKDIKLFEISKNDPCKALLIETVKTMYNVANIIYDEQTEKIYAGIYGSTMEIINLEKNYIKSGNFEEADTFGGFEEIDVKNNYEITDIILMKNGLKGVSSAIKINKNIYLSSSYQNCILIYFRK